MQQISIDDLIVGKDYYIQQVRPRAIYNNDGEIVGHMSGKAVGRNLRSVWTWPLTLDPGPATDRGEYNSDTNFGMAIENFHNGDKMAVFASYEGVNDPNNHGLHPQNIDYFPSITRNPAHMYPDQHPIFPFIFFEYNQGMKAKESRERQEAGEKKQDEGELAKVSKDPQHSDIGVTIKELVKGGKRRKSRRYKRRRKTRKRRKKKKTKKRRKRRKKRTKRR